MRKTLLAAALTFAALLGTPDLAVAETFGADLSRPASNTGTCETGFYDPALIAGTGFPYQSYSSCTWWSGGGIQGTGNAVVPYVASVKLTATGSGPRRPSESPHRRPVAMRSRRGPHAARPPRRRRQAVATLDQSA